MSVPHDDERDRRVTSALNDYPVRHDAGAARFEIRDGDDVALLQYRLLRDRVVFLHTEVPERLRGRGLADKLAQAGLEYARDAGLGVVPLCPFVAAFIQRHPEFEPLVRPT